MAEPRPDKYGPIEVAAPTHTRPPAVTEVTRPGEEPPVKKAARKSAPKGTDKPKEG